jgi:hypothetical protein
MSGPARVTAKTLISCIGRLPCPPHSRWRMYPKMLPRQPAGIISRHTGSADVRSLVVDRARRPDPNLPNKGAAAIAIASHAAPRIIDQRARDPADIGFAFQREARPLGGKGTACTAALARGRAKLGFLCTVVHVNSSLTAESLARLPSSSYATDCPLSSVRDPATRRARCLS